MYGAHLQYIHALLITSTGTRYSGLTWNILKFVWFLTICDVIDEYTLYVLLQFSCVLKIHHFVCVFLNVQPNHSQFCRVVIFDSVDQKKLCMLTFCILLNTAKALVFSWNVAYERGKPPEGAVASFYSTCYIKIWIPSVD